MKQVKILAIGNSFSEDATHYLHQIARAAGIDTKVVNLYIGGCTLQRHSTNIENDSKAYVVQLNGEETPRMASIKEVLLEDQWDFVITQQASYDSGKEETYYPYIFNLYNTVKELAPTAEFLIHQTWAYEIDSDHDGFIAYHRDQSEMFQRLRSCYDKVANELGARMIPCGDVVQMVRTQAPFIYERGGMSLCRDGFHMSFVYGRYLLSATWFEVLLKQSILENQYLPTSKFAPQVVVDEHELSVIKNCVHQVVNEHKTI